MDHWQFFFPFQIPTSSYQHEKIKKRMNENMSQLVVKHTTLLILILYLYIISTLIPSIHSIYCVSIDCIWRIYTMYLYYVLSSDCDLFNRLISRSTPCHEKSLLQK